MAKKNPKIVAIIQARMASNRLPGKALLPLGPNNNSVLWWMLKRASLARLVDEAVIATVLSNSNRPIQEAFPDQTYSWAGDENDVMGRVLWVAKKTNADIIVDLTGDCPLIDPVHIDNLIKILLNWEYEYVSNCVPERTWPDGLDIQVYWTKILKQCKEIFNPSQHCGWNIGQRKIFDSYCNIARGVMNWPELGLTLDVKEDYKLLKIIFNKFGHKPKFHVENIILFLKLRPELVEINKSIRRKTPEEG